MNYEDSNTVYRHSYEKRDSFKQVINLRQLLIILRVLLVLIISGAKGGEREGAAVKLRHAKG